MHETSIKDTACEDCIKKGTGKKRCPNYIETFWHQEGQKEPVLVRDCAPRRTLLMLQDLYNRCYGMQCQINQAEAEVTKQRSVITKLLEAINYMQQEKQLEETARARLTRHLASMKYCEPEEYKKLPDDEKLAIQEQP